MAPVQETFTEALEFTSDCTARAWPNVIKHFDPVLIEEALAATGTATVRKRRLPAERTVWLMLGMSVMRDLPIATVAASLWDTIPDHSLVLIDRHYLQANVLVPLTSKRTERHWITRAKSNTKFRPIRSLGKGDELVEFAVSSEARRKDPTLPTHFDARAIRYQRKGHPPQLLLTSLVDDKRYPAADVRALYHERWEIELGFGEIKTDMLERLETIRSKSPAGVAQEMWGLLLAYNLVRLEIERVANELDVPPIRISFLAALREVVEQWHFATIVSPGTVPARLSTTTDRLRQFLLPPRRPDRVFPRAVKIKMSNYNRKLPTKSSSKSRAK